MKNTRGVNLGFNFAFISKLALAICTIGLSASSASADTTYTWVANSAGDWGAGFKIGHTFGTHEGRPTRGEGTVVFGSSDLKQFKKGAFKIAILDLKAGKAALECHLQEALGLDYARSGYPEDHVCQDDRVPATGPDSIVFPSVEFVISKVDSIGGDRYAIEGVWKIHGKEKAVRLETVLKRDGDSLIVQASSDLSLKDFGVEVKNFLFFVTQDAVRVELNLKLIQS